MSIESFYVFIGLSILTTVVIGVIIYWCLPVNNWPLSDTIKLRNTMHTALMVNSSLNIKTKNMDTPKGENLCNCGPETYLHGKTGTTECGPGNNKIKSLTAVAAVQDNDGHWYIIPNKLHDRFNELLELSQIPNSYDADPDPEAIKIAEGFETEFNEVFNQYRTDGDLNNVQLYAEIK